MHSTAVIQLLGMNTTEMGIYVHQERHTKMSMVALFVIVKNWRQGNVV